MEVVSREMVGVRMGSSKEWNAWDLDENGRKQQDRKESGGKWILSGGE